MPLFHNLDTEAKSILLTYTYMTFDLPDMYVNKKWGIYQRGEDG